METLIYAINAILPIIILIALGYFLRKIKLINDDFLNTANRFVFRICLPALLFFSIYSVDTLEAMNFEAAIFAGLALVVIFVIALIIAKYLIQDKRKRAVIVQGAISANSTIIGIPLAMALGGEVAVANVAIISLVALPLMNGLGVFVLSYYQEQKENIFKTIILRIITNPPIIGVFLGLLAIVIRSFIPLESLTNELVFSLKDDLKFIYLPIKWLSEITSPLALIVLGGTFKFQLIKTLRKEIALGVFLRGILVPTMVLSIAVLLTLKTNLVSFNQAVYPALIAFFASPSAITSAILAKELKGDGDLAVQLVVWTTVLSIFTLFGIVLLFRSFGFL